MSSGNKLSRQILKRELSIPSISAPFVVLIAILHPFLAPTVIVSLMIPNVLFGGIIFFMFPAVGVKSKPSPENVNF